MKSNFTRRQFAAACAAASLAALLPRNLFSQGSASKKAVILADDEIATVRPEFHSHFAEHLGSCTYGGIWVGKNSPIPNIDGYRKATVEYLKALGVPVLRWPGGCFADDYHWRDGIGPAAKRPRSVNITWGHYTGDNSFGTHEFIGFCKLIGAQPYFAANVGTGSPREFRDWIEYCNFPKGSTLSDERAANGSSEPFGVRYWGVGNELWGCGGNFQPEAAAAEFRHYATFGNAMGASGDMTRLTGGPPVYLIGCGPNGMTLREGPQALDAERLGRASEALHLALLQSNPPAPGEDGVLHVFPAWPKEWSASYTLLARGSFLVSASIRDGRAAFVELESQAGAECRLRNPFDGEVTLYRDGAKAEGLKGTMLRFATKKGERVTVLPAGAVLADARRVVPG